MRTILFFIGLFIFSSPVYAGLYAAKKPDGSAVIFRYFETSEDSMTEFLEDVGLSGLPIIAITESDIPKGEKREYLKVNDVPIGKKIVVDEIKKQADLDKEAAKQQKKDKVLQKLGISEQELEELLV